MSQCVRQTSKTPQTEELRVETARWFNWPYSLYTYCSATDLHSCCHLPHAFRTCGLCYSSPPLKIQPMAGIVIVVSGMQLYDCVAPYVN